jgi:hypothetical protein
MTPLPFRKSSSLTNISCLSEEESDTVHKHSDYVVEMASERVKVLDAVSLLALARANERCIVSVRWVPAQAHTEAQKV